MMMAKLVQFIFVIHSYIPEMMISIPILIENGAIN